MLVGAVQVVPLNVMASPPSSTAAQKEAVGHDTDVRVLVDPGLMSAGAVQVVPLNVTAFPCESTATQKEAVGHDTDVRVVVKPGLISAGAVQVAPLNCTALPPEPTATQNDADAHETDRNPDCGVRIKFCPLPLKVSIEKGSRATQNSLDGQAIEPT